MSGSLKSYFYFVRHRDTLTNPLQQGYKAIRLLAMVKTSIITASKLIKKQLFYLFHIKSYPNNFNTSKIIFDAILDLRALFFRNIILNKPFGDI